MMIKAIIFDMGGVLVENPFHGMVAHYTKSLGVDIETYLNVFDKYETAWLKGEFSEDEFWHKITTELHVSKPQVESLWLDGYLSTYREKKDIFTLIRKLKQNRYRIALLSNTEIPIMNFIKQQKWQDFDLFVYSCEIGMRKPDNDIYKYTIKALNIDPDEAVFIDDKLENIESANKLGLYGIQFKKYFQLLSELKAIGINI